MSRRRGRSGMVAAVAGVLFAAALLLGRSWLLRPAPLGDGQAVEFRVEAGEGLAPVARRLETRELTRSAFRLRCLARLTGRDREIRAGLYRLERGLSPRELLDDLVAGRVLLRRVTVPEGWRIEQIAAEVERVLGIPAAALRAETASSKRRVDLECDAPTLEGYLFPETYLLPDGATAVDVVDAMTTRFLDVWDSLPGASPAGFDRHDVVTLASIVEAETPLPEERAHVAAVYLRRLDLGWRLQADPTVRYGLERFGGRLLYEHLDIDTPWNTYLHRGLPPGPIAAPGLGALAAVKAPLEPCDDLYFVASGEGGHIFSKTKAEHDRARRAVKRRAKTE